MKRLFVLLITAAALCAGVSEGEKAPGFTLKTLDGSRTYTLKSFEGDVVLLNFWASWCSGCQKEMPEFFKLQKNGGDGFRIVTVSIDKDPENSTEFLEDVAEETGIPVPFVTLYDPEKKLPRAYGARGMPSSYLIDRDGVVRLVIVGSLDGDDIVELRREIDRLR